MEIHPGIVIHKIPANGGGGLIFALGIGSLFLLLVPSFLPLVGACLLAGFGVALLLRQLAPLPATQVAGAVPVFLVGAALALLTPTFGAFALACLAGGLGVAYLLNRASLSRRPVTIRSLAR
jgi:hypothetical protein